MIPAQKLRQSKIYAAAQVNSSSIFLKPQTMSLIPTHFSRQILSLACLMALSLPSAWAEKADRTKPMNAEADSLRYDDVKQTSVFTGNVVITKGTMIIRADRVEVRQDNEGFQFGTATSTGGKRAFFRQKRDAGDEWIEGEGEIISYDGKADTVSFSRNATLRRLRGASLTDETQGALITYDNTSDVFNVAGSAAPGGSASSGNPSGRVRAVLTPRAATSTPSTSAPSASSPTGPTLRPSTTIGGDKK
jgi:lipopolysaccharide export system protein LptA